MRESVLVVSNRLADARSGLLATTHDVEKAASHCYEAYLNGGGEKSKYDISVAFAAKSLMQVARHISNCSEGLLGFLDQQSDVLSALEGEISMLKMSSNIYREKVARKAIGSCTVVKAPIHVHRDLPQQEYATKYIRQPLDYDILDGIGHGFPPQDGATNPYGRPNPRGTLTKQSGATVGSIYGVPQRPLNTPYRPVNSRTGLEYAAPVNNVKLQSGTVGRTAGIYRTSMVPSHHLLNPIGSGVVFQHSGGASPSGGSLSSSNYAPGVVTSGSDVNYATSRTQSRRSSGSSSAGSNAVQQHSHYASNPHIQQANYGQPTQAPHTNQTKPQYLAPGSAYAGGASQIHQPINVVHVPSDVYPGQPDFKSVNMSQHTYDPMQNRWVNNQPTLTPQRQADNSMIERLNSTLQRRQTAELAQDIARLNLVNTREQVQIQKNQQLQRQAGGVTSDLHSSALIPPPGPYAGTSYNENSNDLQQHQQEAVTVDPMQGQDVCLIQKQPGDPPWAPDFYLEKVITVYEYVRDKDDELTFYENQLIYVIKKNDDGWWEGIMNGDTGLFPGNYVESLDFD